MMITGFKELGLALSYTLIFVGPFFAALLFAIATIIVRKIGEDEPLLAFSLFGSVISMQAYGVITFWDGEVMIPTSCSGERFSASRFFPPCPTCGPRWARA